MGSDGRFTVLVAGGGVAGLEALLALRDLAGERVAVTVVAPEEEFVFRPMAVAAPFARGRTSRRPLRDLVRDAGGELVQGKVVEVDDGERRATLDNGDGLGYHALLVAVGAGSEPALQRAMTWTPERDGEVLGGLLRDLDEGYSKTVAFVVPPGAMWPLPAYELALMTGWQARSMGQDDISMTIYTYEEAPLAAFGKDAAAALRDDLDEVGVEVQTGVFVDEEDGAILVHPGRRRVDAQRIVSLAAAVPREVRGVPVDAAGFIPVDLHGKVAGADGLWAAGDAIAFPIKQGGLAAQQADAAAEAIAAVAGADVDPQPFRPVLRGVVLTGRGRQWVRRDLAGDGEDVARDEGSAERHALWWPPTKVAGRYLSPLLASMSDGASEDERPDGQPVELDVAEEVPGAADALRQAGRRTPDG